MTTLDAVKVAVIGCGRIAGHHCRSIAMADGVELLAVCDLVQEKAAAYGREFGVPHFVNYHEMFRAIPAINTVAIVTPSGMHFEHATEILNLYRKHLIVEKPTFMKPQQVRDAFSLSESLGVQLFPVFQNRHNLAVRRVRQGLLDGELGRVRIAAVRVRWCRPQRYYDLAAWRGTFSQDGGALTNQGVHHVDLLRYLVGNVRHVSAVMRTLGAQIEVEDAAVGWLAFADGAMGVAEVTTAARPIDYEAAISLVCENGLAQIGGIAVNELQVFTPDPAACATWSEDFSGNVYGHGHRVIYQDIARTLLGGVPYPVDRSDCLGTVQLLNALYRSDETGEPVDVASAGESTRLGRPDDALASLYRTALPR
jgi:UDP-N-acetyl-2-amino-2-deoxyglucuronate dehydrogenase